MENALTHGLQCLMEYPECAFAWGRYTIRDARDAVWEPSSDSNQHGDAYAALLRGNHIGMHATVLYRREALRLVGGFDARLPACEDYELYLRIARRSPIIKHEHIVAEYRKHGSNMSVDSLMMLATVLNVMEAQRDYVDGNTSYQTAYAEGIRFWKRFYGVRSIGKVAREVCALRFAKALADAVYLFRIIGASTVLMNAPVWLFRHWLADYRRERQQ
jgi:hypothetical protein